MDSKLPIEFNTNSGATEEAISSAEVEINFTLPEEYKIFVRRTNGGDGFLGENYLILWTVEEIPTFNKEYQVNEYAPGLILFASTGGGEAYAFDTRTAISPVVQVPFIGMDLTSAKPVAAGFAEFLAKLAGCP